MGWQWKYNEKRSHVYYFLLWEHNYMEIYTWIYDHLMNPMYTLIFFKLTQYMTKKDMHVIGALGDWYIIDSVK